MVNFPIASSSLSLSKKWLLTTSLLFGILLSSCRPLVGTERISKFSEATNSVTQGVSDAYVAVESSYRDASLLSLLAQPDESLTPNRFQPWIPVNSRNLRTDVLHGIATYAEELTKLASGEQLQEIDQPTKDLAATLMKVGDEDVRKAFPTLTKLTPENVSVFATAVNAIGSSIIKRKSTKAIKQEIIAMDPMISNVSLTLAEEIGKLKLDEDGSVASGSSGLRADAWNHFDTQAMALSQLFSKIDAKDVMLKRKIAEDFADSYRQQLLADATLAAAASALESVAKTHTALKQAYDKKNVSVTSEIRKLSGEAKRLRDFYHSLNEKKEE